MNTRSAVLELFHAYRRMDTVILHDPPQEYERA
jgi:hypothetical protein